MSHVSLFSHLHVCLGLAKSSTLSCCFFVALFVSWSEAIFWFFSTRCLTGCWCYFGTVYDFFCFHSLMIQIFCSNIDSTILCCPIIIDVVFFLLFHHAGVCSISTVRNIDEWISNLGCPDCEVFLCLVLWSIISISAAILIRRMWTRCSSILQTKKN